MISVYQNLALEQSKNNINNINFYDVLDYDLIIKDNNDPVLLEINKNPSKIFDNDLVGGFIGRFYLNKIKIPKSIFMFIYVVTSFFSSEFIFYNIHRKIFLVNYF